MVIQRDLLDNGVSRKWPEVRLAVTSVDNGRKVLATNYREQSRSSACRPLSRGWIYEKEMSARSDGASIILSVVEKDEKEGRNTAGAGK